MEVVFRVRKGNMRRFADEIRNGALVDAEGVVVLRKKLRRGAVLEVPRTLPPGLIGMEACASAHHWARMIARLGHDVRLTPPAYAGRYVKRQKNDAADAEASPVRR
jgi:transposase